MRGCSAPNDNARGRYLNGGLRRPDFVDALLTTFAALIAYRLGLLIFAGGYFYVGFNSLYALYKMNQEAAAAELADPAEAIST